MDKESIDSGGIPEEGDSTHKPLGSAENTSKTKAEEVSSKAIVKYSAQEILPYYKLQQDTNLNVAPSNWLRDGRFSGVDHNRRDPVDFSSFGMAHSFVDSIGDVDVISDAENIKKLLTIPYSTGSEVSLAVHRVGQTLLLDCLDVPALISYASQGRDGSIYPQWLYDFYCEQTGIPKDERFQKKKKKKDQKKSRHIFSKFIHYSIQNLNSDATADSSFATYTEAEASPVGDSSASTAYDEGVSFNDPEPSSSEELSKNADIFPSFIHEVDSQKESFHLPQVHQDSSFQHNILWQFEDIQMLVGSNLPIFGGGKYPAVSLRLRECGKPINVLTGLDYWLDNLMCNVPEVAMCYHLDGIVQYYDLYKTEELPDLDGSSFSPKVVKDVAQNILSFMKSNCTKEGHTYWLFKATGSGVIKLYDLSSICQQRTDDNTENLFTIPVATLFYRVAENMMNQSPLSARDRGTIRQLLNNCLLLLDSDRFPEIFSSASLLLSDLYSPDDVHALPAINTNDQQETTEEEGSYDGEADFLDLSLAEDEKEITAVALKSLDVTKLSTPVTQQDEWIKVSKPLPSNVEERCKVALSYIVKGLACVKKHFVTGVASREESTDNSFSEECFSSPFKSPTSKTVGAKSSRSPPHAVVPSFKNQLPLCKTKKTPLIPKQQTRWQDKTAGSLFRKAAAVYHSLACMFNSNGKFGRGLKNCKLAFKCHEASRVFGAESDIKEDDQLLIEILYVCGDAYLMLATCQENLAVHQEDYHFKSEEDTYISEAAEDCISSEQGHSSSVKFVCDLEQNMQQSGSLYDAALQLCSVSTKISLVVNITKRLGNVKNELGVLYMNKAAGLIDSGAEPTFQDRELWKKSFSNFESGIRTFDVLDDSANKALLLSNLGRLMRICAQAAGGVESKITGRRGEFSQEERGYFNKAFEFYNKALRCLADRKKNPVVWDTITWELCGSYFTMATLLQDFAPLSTYAQEQVEKDVTELMMKALRLCESSTLATMFQSRSESSRQLDYRIFSIHHRLASLYHNSYRNQVVDHSKKKARSLAELHYGKASVSLRPAEYPCDYIRIHLEQVAMCEYHITTHGGSAAVIRTLQTALEHLFTTWRALEYVGILKDETARSQSQAAKREDNEKRAGSEIKFDELKNLVPILESRLTNVLKELVKANTVSKNKGKSSTDWGGLETAKKMYSAALRRGATSADEGIVEKCRRVAELLKNLERIRKEHSNI